MNINEKRKDETRQEIHDIVSELRKLIQTLYTESHEQLFKIDSSIDDGELTLEALLEVLYTAQAIPKKLSKASVKIDFLYRYCKERNSSQVKELRRKLIELNPQLETITEAYSEQRGKVLRDFISEYTHSSVASDFIDLNRIGTLSELEIEDIAVHLSKSLKNNE